MHEYLFPVPGRVLRGLLECKARSGEAFSSDEATLDVLLALDRESREDEPLKPYRYLAHRWKWSYSRVQRSMNTLKNTARDWRSFFHSSNRNESRRHHVEPDSPPPGPAFDDSESRSIPDESLLQQYRTDPDTDIDTLSPPRAGSIFLNDSRGGRGEASPASGDKPAGYTMEEVRQEAGAVALDEVEAEKFFWHYENAGWHRVRNLPAALHKWKLYGYSYRTRTAVRPFVAGCVSKDGLYAGTHSPARAGVRSRAPERGVCGRDNGKPAATLSIREEFRRGGFSEAEIDVLCGDEKGGVGLLFRPFGSESQPGGDRDRYIEAAEALWP